MPIRVKVDGVGVVEFPDGMSPADMNAALQKHLSKASQSQPQTLGLPFTAGFNQPNSIFGQIGDLGSKAIDLLARKPVVQQPGETAKDFYKRRAIEDASNMAIGAGVSGVHPAVATELRMQGVKAEQELQKAIKNLEAFGPREAMARRYPELAPPVMKIDPTTGKEFAGKQLSPEAEAVQAVRKAAQKKINAGLYEPYFPVEQRFDVDPTQYPLTSRTINEVRPVKPETVAKYQAQAESPDASKRLMGAFKAAKGDPLAHNWYAMGQLEAEYRKELGDLEGRAAFKRDFADAMAATTGGADPTSNLMMAHYGNYLRNLGEDIPESSSQFPFPIGGRYAKGNMDMYDKIINKDQGLGMGTPKRHNFSGNFLGHSDISTIDEQESGLFDPAMMSPPGQSYGIYEQALAKQAKKAGTTPRNFQEVSWAGAKGTQGKPMIQHVNEAIERTHQVTGLPHEEVVRGMIRKTIPLFGLGVAAVPAIPALTSSPEQQ